MVSELKFTHKFRLNSQREKRVVVAPIRDSMCKGGIVEVIVVNEFVSVVSHIKKI
jgi:hypothetical protein